MPSTLRGRLVMTKWNFERVQAPRVPQSAALSEATNAGRTNQCAPELGKHASVGRWRIWGGPEFSTFSQIRRGAQAAADRAHQIVASPFP